uniref:C-type lectin domain-containing protein n=1 Tax=Steinernema glaseri TaxID=37863 RepID=A0A1I7Z1Z5_9BILA
MSLLRSVPLLLLLGVSASERVCPPGAVTSSDRSKCFLIVPVPVSFYDAERTCLDLGARFASVTDAIDNERISETAYAVFMNLRMKASNLWLGGTDKDSDSWTWLDGSNFTFSNWADAPSAASGRCVSLDSSTGLWYAEPCVNKASYVCERDSIAPKPSPTPCPTPTQPVCPTCAFCPMTTSTCPPSTECPPCPSTPFPASTTPATSKDPTATTASSTTTSNAPTTRYAPSTSPTISFPPTSDPTTLPPFSTSEAPTTTSKTSSTTPPSSTPAPLCKQFGSHLYCLHLEPRSWQKAKERCGADGGDLASILSEEENAFVASLSGGMAWIGAFSPHRNNTFAWSDGSQWAFSSWLPGEPVNFSGQFSCVSASSLSMASPTQAQYFTEEKWYSNSCDSVLTFVCKKKNT